MSKIFESHGFLYLKINGIILTFDFLTPWSPEVTHGGNFNVGVKTMRIDRRGWKRVTCFKRVKSCKGREANNSITQDVLDQNKIPTAAGKVDLSLKLFFLYIKNTFKSIFHKVSSGFNSLTRNTISLFKSLLNKLSHSFSLLIRSLSKRISSYTNPFFHKIYSALKQLSKKLSIYIQQFFFYSPKSHYVLGESINKKELCRFFT